jgi:hypothetical protein
LAEEPHQSLEVLGRRREAERGAVDMSESEISAQLKLEVSVGEVVELEFELPSAPVAIRAVVRCKTAFRHPVEEN